MRRWPVTLVDVAVIVVFVAVGRSAHHHAQTVAGFVSTTWPFAAGLACGWVLTRRWPPDALRTGAAVCVTTVAVGMVLRVVAGQGTAVAFIGVALGFLGACMLAGRILVRRLAGRAAPVRG